MTRFQTEAQGNLISAYSVVTSVSCFKGRYHLYEKKKKLVCGGKPNETGYFSLKFSVEIQTPGFYWYNGKITAPFALDTNI